MHCVFCRNSHINQHEAGIEVQPQRLAQMMLELQDNDWHNIDFNFITPAHVVPQILEALPYAIDGGLRLPTLYNTSSFDPLESVQHIDSIVDIHLPDFKYWDNQRAHRYLKSPKYPAAARAAIKEMHRQVRDLVLDE